MNTITRLFGLFTLIWAIVAVNLCSVSGQGFLTNGLIAYYPFNGNADDASGNGNNGTIEGSPLPSWVAGLHGGDALSFNGVNDQYISIPASSSLKPSSITVSAWVYVTGLSFTEDQVMFAQGVTIFPIIVLSKGTNWQFYSYIKDANGAVHSNVCSGSLNLNQWYFLTFTYDSSGNFNQYVNGVNVFSSATGGVGLSTSETGWQIGGVYNGSYYGYFQGLIDDVRIYNRALSATEIQTDFQQAPDFSPYLLANVPQGTTQVITTLSWQGTGNINVTITTPSQTYTESTMQEYEKTTYSTTSGGPLSMLNIKRLSISVPALTSAQAWNITLTYDNTVSAYQISVETQN